MAITYPTTLDTFTNPGAAERLGASSPVHSVHHANLNDAVEALEAKVGADSSAVTSSHDYKIDQLETNSATQAGIQAQTYTHFTDTGAADAYVITPSPAITAYAAGQRFSFIAVNASTGASTLNVNGLGVKTIKKRHDDDIESGDIEATALVEVVYDGTNFQLTSQTAEQPTDINGLTSDETLDANDQLIFYDDTEGANNKRTAKASETNPGLVEKATDAEVDTGTDDERFVTPAQLLSYVRGAIAFGTLNFSNADGTYTGTISTSSKTPNLMIAFLCCGNYFRSVGMYDGTTYSCLYSTENDDNPKRNWGPNATTSSYIVRCQIEDTASIDDGQVRMTLTGFDSGGVDYSILVDQGTGFSNGYILYVVI